MTGLRENMRHIFVVLRSPKGHDIGMFCIFVAISAILWGVLALNEEEQRDIRIPVRLTHVPDSITMLARGPESINASVLVRGSQLLKMSMSSPSLNVDYRVYRQGDHVFLSNADLKALVRNTTGSSQVAVLYPDSISIPFTANPGVRVPVDVDYDVSAGPRSAMVGRPRLSADSVEVFTAGGTHSIRSVRTEPIVIAGLDGRVTRRVRLVAPSGARLIPDSVDVTFEAEPLIIKTRKVVIEPVNVPEGTRLITFPAQMTVTYMVPMSSYTSTDPRFRVVADYRKINRSNGSNMMKLSIVDVPRGLRNVFLANDSAEYIIEQL